MLSFDKVINFTNCIFRADFQHYQHIPMFTAEYRTQQVPVFPPRPNHQLHDESRYPVFNCAPNMVLPGSITSLSPNFNQFTCVNRIVSPPGRVLNPGFYTPSHSGVFRPVPRHIPTAKQSSPRTVSATSTEDRCQTNITKEEVKEGKDNDTCAQDGSQPTSTQTVIHNTPTSTTVSEGSSPSSGDSGISERSPSSMSKSSDEEDMKGLQIVLYYNNNNQIGKS